MRHDNLLHTRTGGSTTSVRIVKPLQDVAQKGTALQQE